MALGGYDGSVRIDTKLDNSGFKDGLKNIQSGLGSLKSSLGKLAGAVGVAFGVAQLVLFGKEAIDLASDLGEVQNVVDTAFGAMSGQVDEWAKNSIKQFGMSELAAKQMASTYMAMNAGMGMSGQGAAEMAMKTAERAADVASFYNKSVEESDTMLKSIWTGETESLKQIGVVMTQTNLDAFALANGFGKTTQKMTQAEQVQLRYAYVMEQTRLASGDFLKTQDSWANQTRILSEQWKQFLGIMGEGLIQVLTPALKFLNQFIGVLIGWAQQFSAIVSAIFGKSVSQANTAVSSTQAAAGAQKELASATKQANKETKKQLASFDELNVLQKNAESSGAPDSMGGSGGGAAVSVPALSGEIGADVKISPAVQQAADTIRGIFEKINIALGPTKAALQGLWGEFERLGGFVWQGLLDFYYDFLEPIGRWALGKGLPGFINALTDGLASINWEHINKSLRTLWQALEPFAETIGEGLLWLWKNVLVPLAAWTISNVLPVFLDLLAEGIKFVTSAIKAGGRIFSSFFNSVLKPLGEFAGKAFVKFLKAIKPFVPIILSLAGGFLALKGATALLTGLSGALLKLALSFETLRGLQIGPLFLSLPKAIKEVRAAFSLLGEQVVLLGKQLWEAILSNPWAAIITALAAALVAVGIGIYNANKAAQEARDMEEMERIFGGTAVQAEHLEQVLAPMTVQFDSFTQRLSEHNSAAENVRSEYEQTATALDVLYTQLQTGTEEIPGYAETIYTSLQSLGESLKKATEEDTRYYYSSWQETFTNVGTLTKEEQTQVLGSIVQLGEDKKSKIDEIENQITEIHTAAKERNVGQTVTYTEEELAKLKGFQDDLDALMAIERNKELEKSKIESAQLLDDIKSGRLKVTNETYEELLDTIQQKEDESTQIAKDNLNQQLVDADAYWESAKATYDEGSDELLDAEKSYHIQSQQAYEQYNKSIEEAYTTSFNTRKILTTKLQEEADEYEKVSDKIKEYNKLNNEIIANEKSVATSYAAGNPELKDKKERLKELSEELENNDLAVKNWLRGWQLKSPKAKEEVDKMVDAIDTSMSNSVNKFLTYGIDSAEGFRKGCDKKMGEVKAKAAELAQGSLDAVATTMDSHSPSRKMETLGVNAVEGFIIGVENNKQAVLDAFTNLFNALLGKVETFSKNVADSVNSTLRNLASSMDSVRINGSGKVRYTAMAYSQIPRLAQGAVIPPNQQFLAMLGDQKSGTNVEAPLSTIEQAVQNVWQKNGGGQEITLRLVSDRGFVRNLKIELDKESQRRGVKLVRGGAY